MADYVIDLRIRVATDGEWEPTSLQERLQRRLSVEHDGRRSFSVEVLHDAVERLVDSATSSPRDGVAPACVWGHTTVTLALVCPKCTGQPHGTYGEDGPPCTACNGTGVSNRP